MVVEKGWKAYLSDLVLEKVRRRQWVDSSY